MFSQLHNEDLAERWLGVGVLLVNALARELGHAIDVAKDRLQLVQQSIR